MYLSLPYWHSMHSISCFFHFLYVMVVFLPVGIIFTAVYNTSISTFDCVHVCLCMLILFFVEYACWFLFLCLLMAFQFFSVLLVQYNSCPTIFIYAKFFIFLYCVLTVLSAYSKSIPFTFLFFVMFCVFLFFCFVCVCVCMCVCVCL